MSAFISCSIIAVDVVPPLLLFDAIMMIDHTKLYMRYITMRQTALLH
jgi:hypothetical protein